MNITFGLLLWIVLLIGLLVYGVIWLMAWNKRRQSATMLAANEFDATRRQAQLIDVRESNDFHSAHIVGARNIPYSSLQQNGVPGLNRKQPIYLYDNGVAIAGRFASKLREAGYEDIYILKGGFQAWEGKTKRRQD